jgi:hypothetical protein
VVETLLVAIDQRHCQVTSAAAARPSLRHCQAEESIAQALVVTDLESAVEIGRVLEVIVQPRCPAVSIGRTQGIDPVSAAIAQASVVIVQPPFPAKSIVRGSVEVTVQVLEVVIDRVSAVIVHPHSQA